MTPFVHASNLAIGYSLRNHPPRVVSENIFLELHPGELVCLVGPNGSGKSTLLRTITGLHAPLKGEVILNGKNVRDFTPVERARIFSLVLTTPVQVGQLRVYDLIGLGRYPYTDWAGTLTPDDHEAIRHSLVQVGIESFSRRYLHELSDGERQKVMIARALAQNPKIVILDEPTAFLDFPFRIEILTMLRKITRNEDKGILLSTHDLDLAMRLADRLWIISRDGSFHCGAPEDLVLDGVISHVFDSGRIFFDCDSGQFTLPSTCQGSVRLSGENGKTRFWTMRALNRMGYSTEGRDTPVLSVHISSEESGQTWKVCRGKTEASFSNLTDLTRWIVTPEPQRIVQ